MKSTLRLRLRQLHNVQDNLLEDWRYVTTAIGRRGNLILVVTLTFCVGFLSGVFSRQSIPKTLFTRPILTLEMMKSFPIGSSVLPKNTPQAKEEFAPLGWWREPAVVVGYDTITYKQEVIIVCQVRTHQGEGDVLIVNPSWLELTEAPANR